MSSFDFARLVYAYAFQSLYALHNGTPSLAMTRERIVNHVILDIMKNNIIMQGEMFKDIRGEARVELSTKMLSNDSHLAPKEFSPRVIENSIIGMVDSQGEHKEGGVYEPSP